MKVRDTDDRLILLDGEDNVLVARAGIYANETIRVEGHGVTLPATISMGHKLALHAIAEGQAVIKFGAIIGSASRDIALGEHVHLQNLKSNYTATHTLEAAKAAAGGEKN